MSEEDAAAVAAPSRTPFVKPISHPISLFHRPLHSQIPLLLEQPSSLSLLQDGDMYKGFGSELEDKQNDEDKEDEVVGDGEEELEMIVTEEEKRMKKKEGRIPLPWELLQPVLRILGHCLMGLNNSKEKELFVAASDACRCLYARVVHDVNPKAILATSTLLKLLKRLEDNKYDDFDHFPNVISLTFLFVFHVLFFYPFGHFIFVI